MNDPDNFLSRWSRRKREAGESKEKKDKNEMGEAAAAPASETGQDKPAAPIPEFDVESLPPIESISAETDITAFMRTGVPETIKHAALRRAWSADPAIRDFMGLNENYWDAAGPDGVPGFGELDPGLDVKRLLSELFGETRREEAAQAGAQQQISSDDPSNERTNIPSGEVPSPAATDTDLSQRTENVAAQNESSEAAPLERIARRHGGAMPQ